ncbi:nicotinate-nucleotide--dimethylbenzimidazole phosphoribosyltransferase [Streptomyces sp. AC550_RSS872]|uniref:nicotinate-nucleotide--dimethylbenzimidazole phosphoribosyltransferase n=1 Tax=Streptomyces sp. AC550_RSS872 TaxID=2823689 RepID=UPI001C275C25|nr:nicotinate-nucleotide--dimethylbenzimidazole phosphoribosyltransferase [Streptomyces sp. AC550_RSS872]
MTDTGQVPGEGLPESAGMVEQPGAPAAHGSYTYLSETTAEDEDLLLPGSQGAWGNEVAPPAPEPVVEAVHEPDAHEISGRDSGSVDLSAVRLPGPSAPTTPIPPITPRRPLHLGPPLPDASASPVRSLADRGAVGAPVRQPGQAPAGPEYLDVPQPQAAAPQPAAPWGAPAPVAVQVQAPAPAQVSAEGTAAETVVPTGQSDVAQAVVSRVAGAAQADEVPAAAPAVPAAGAGEAAEAPEAPVAEAADPVAVADQAPEGSVPEADAPAADAVAAPAAAADAAADAVADAGQLPEAPQAPEAEGDHASEGPAPEAAQLPAPEADPAPEAAQLPEEPAAEADAIPEAPAPEAVQTPDAPAPVAEAVQVPDAAVPAAPVPAPVAEPPVPEAPQAPEAPQFPEAAQAPEAPAPVDGPQPTPEAAPLPPASDAAQVEAAPEPEAAPESEVAPEPEHLASAEQPTDAVAEPADTAPAASSPEPAPQPSDAEQPAQQESEPAVPVAQPVEEPQAPEVAADPNLAQAQQPVEDAVPSDAPGLEEPAAAASAPLPEAEAPVAEPTAEFPEAPQAPEVTAEPSASPQPLAAANPVVQDTADPQPAPAEAVPAETPEPFVAEPAGPQLQSPAAQPVQVFQDPAQPPVEPAQSAQPEVLQEPAPEQPLGQFVPVEGSVPTTPHLAPTPPQPIVLPAEEAPASVATVPAPREGDPGLVQHAEDLDTRAADQDDPQAPAAPEEESTAAVEEPRQPTGPAAPAYDDAEREAVLKVMRERRDIRNGFRGDPIPHEVLLRVLEAAHTAPSVGHSQPWDFVVIRSADTRRTMHELAMRQRDAYAKSLPKGRAKQFKELKIEAILDTPVNIVVTADPTRGGRHTLGRHTQPQMAPYSAALAVENLWLAARAEGLGVGWVSFFDEREMVRALGLPEHLEVIAYLCVGYVDEFPDEPELMQAGWSKRRPLSWVVHEETYGRRALPGEEPHDLLGETVAQIRPLDAKALGEAWERQKRMTKPAGALGMLEIISAQLSGLSRQCPPPIPEPAAVAIFAGDHGVHAQGVTPWPQEVTAQMVANFLGGGAVCNAFAGQVGAEVCVVDVGVAADLPATPGLLPRKVRAGTSDMTTGPAMTREEAKQAIEVGIETARDLVAAGNKALLTGEMGIANTTASAALISVFTDTDPADVTGRGTGINDETLARKTEVVRRAIEVHQPDPADPIGVLAAIGGFEHAAIVGLLLGGASLRTPVILDGVSAGAAALVARAIAPEVLAACIAGHRSAEPGHVAALNKLGLRPLVDLDLRLGEGTGALLALPLVQSTARAMHEVATFDSAGVTEK